MSPRDSQTTALSAATVVFLQEKYLTAIQEYENAILAVLQAKTHIADCLSAARVLGVKLPARVPAPSAGRPATVKAFVVSVVKDSNPSPISTSEINNRLRSQGFSVHEKTAGVCLNRLTKTGKIARANHAIGRGNQSMWILPPAKMPPYRVAPMKDDACE